MEHGLPRNRRRRDARHERVVRARARRAARGAERGGRARRRARHRRQHRPPGGATAWPSALRTRDRGERGLAVEAVAARRAAGNGDAQGRVAALRATTSGCTRAPATTTTPSAATCSSGSGGDETHAPTDDQLTHDELPDTWLTIYGSSVLAGAPCGVIFPIKGGESCVECGARDRILLRDAAWAESTPCYDLTGISEYEVLLYRPRDAAPERRRRPAAPGADRRAAAQARFHSRAPSAPAAAAAWSTPTTRSCPSRACGGSRASSSRPSSGRSTATARRQRTRSSRSYLDERRRSPSRTASWAATSKQRVAQYPPCDPRLLAHRDGHVGAPL